jgi:MtN3 and saliva related transmembrane protein
MPALANSVGFFAGMLTTAADVPQVLKTYKTKSGEGLSFRMLLCLALGLALWVLYGAMGNSLPLIVANGAGLVLIIALIAMKLKFDRVPTKD